GGKKALSTSVVTPAHHPGEQPVFTRLSSLSAAYVDSMSMTPSSPFENPPPLSRCLAEATASARAYLSTGRPSWQSSSAASQTSLMVARPPPGRMCDLTREFRTLSNADAT